MTPSTNPSADLEIHVWIELSGGKDVLMYQIHSPSAGFNFLKVRGPELGVAPEVFGRQFLDQLEKLHEGFDVEGQQLLLAEAADDLVSLGRSLYQSLFPPEMKTHYRRFRQIVQTIQITSTEAAIPWELIKPYDDGDRAEIIDDDFLCMRFQLTRWLAGSTSPRDHFPVRRLACIGGSPTRSGISKSLTERQLLADLTRRHPGAEDASPPGTSFADVENLFKTGGIDLYHFVGHGDFVEGNPGEAKIVLSDRPFRARNLLGPIQTRMREDRPFVLFNACRVARQGWSLAGLDGWAQAWVTVCECGAFIGPHWLVKASAAEEFARILYVSLENGQTLGEAALAARHALRKLDAGRPNWLAFAVYGNPKALMTFGGQELAPPALTLTQADVRAPDLPPSRPALKPAPTNAPPAPEIFVGRTGDLDRLKERLGVGADAGDSTEVQVLTAVRGWPGVGKTSLAAVLAHDPDIASRFEGVLWASLGQEPDLLGEMAGWGRWLRNDDLYRAGSFKEASSSLKALLRDRRLVVILDDVWEATHAAAFQSVSGPGCSLVVTTRESAVAQSLVMRPEAVYLLDVLNTESAFDLLRRLAPEVVEDHPEEIRRLVDELECLPLALQVAGRLLREEGAFGWGIEDLLRDLANGGVLLNSPAPPDRIEATGSTLLPTISILLRRSTDRLDVETRERFRLLGGFVAKPATFGLDVLKHVWAVEDPRPTVRELVRRGLLEPSGEGRFQIHSLLLRHAETMPAAT